MYCLQNDFLFEVPNILNPLCKIQIWSSSDMNAILEQNLYNFQILRSSIISADNKFALTTFLSRHGSRSALLLYYSTRIDLTNIISSIPGIPGALSISLTFCLAISKWSNLGRTDKHICSYHYILSEASSCFYIKMDTCMF